MIALSKYLYIVDDLKWSFIDAILNKRIKESIFWITEYYESGYRKETWQLLWVVYDSFYFANNVNYQKIMLKKYKKWKKTDDFMCILDVVYKFYKMKNFDFAFFKIYFGSLKYKKTHREISDNLYIKLGLNRKNIFKNLICGLEDEDYKCIWFFINLNYKVSLYFIEKYYDDNVSISYDNIRDKKVQLLNYVYITNNPKLKNKKNFTIKARKDYVEFYKNLLVDQGKYNYKKLEKRRLYGVPQSIGCFNLERFNFSDKNIENMYFYNWEYCASLSPLWKERFESWVVDFNTENNPNFMNDELMEKFYEKFGLEPDEQSIETHNKSICHIEQYDITDWLSTFK